MSMYLTGEAGHLDRPELSRDKPGFQVTTRLLESNEEKAVMTQASGEGNVDRLPAVTKPKGVVGTSRGLTINLGQFQTARIDVWASSTYGEGEEKETYRRISDFVEGLVQEEVQKVMCYKEKGNQNNG